MCAVAIVGNAMAGQSSTTNATTKSATNAAGQQIVCPAVAPSLPAIPASAKAEVDRNLALLDTQIAEANQRLISTQGQGGANFVNNAILGPLKDKRVSTIDRIAIAIGRTAAKPAGLDSLAACSLSTASASANPSAVASSPAASASASATNAAGQGQNQAGGVNRTNGPQVADFVDITKVAPNVLQKPQVQATCGSRAPSPHAVV